MVSITIFYSNHIDWLSFILAISFTALPKGNCEGYYNEDLKYSIFILPIEFLLPFYFLYSECSLLRWPELDSQNSAHFTFSLNLFFFFCLIWKSSFNSFESITQSTRLHTINLVYVALEYGSRWNGLISKLWN